MTWPEDPTTVKSLLREYERQKIETPPKIFDVKGYYKNKKDKAEAAILKVRKDILKEKYLTWHPNFNKMDEKNLISFITSIEEKIEACNGKISMLKDMQQSDRNLLQNTPHMQIMVQENVGIPQMQQQIHAPMKSIDEISEIIQAENVTIPRIQQQTHAPTKSIDDISEMVVQENVFIRQMQQQIHPPVESIDYFKEMMNFTDLVDLPSISSTKQLVDCGNQVVNHDNSLVTQLDDPVGWTNYPQMSFLGTIF
ncbi:hypothetical protein TSUD_373010 [Trifolium subterraneum]|uniref:MADS-box domain-containing protein n=1 Tax=Trifolium subterraneum TaxID=3900 RepID=A0A2Z6NH00_TRISU|nr:hypothetical protein TSUD_373010 [Trifolium subterraneum]